MERGTEMNLKDEAGLGLAIHWVQQALISAYVDNSPLAPVKTGRHSLKRTSELEGTDSSLRNAEHIRISIVGNYRERGLEET